jgi:ubiquinone/menaquinone biosynthesis C-methylase UbiE
MTDTPIQSGEIFQAWDLYARIVHENWMKHREMQQAIRDAVREAIHSQPAIPLRVLDLGCGDGTMAFRGLADADVESYAGIDLSEDALSQCAQRPGPGRRHVVNKWLHRGDLAAKLSQWPQHDVDVVLASYSLHHFSTDAKSAILADISRVLRPGGRFLWIDIVRAPGESRDVFLDRIEQEIREQWMTMPEAERQAAVEHIRECDFPESEAWMVDQWRSMHGDRVHGNSKRYCPMQRLVHDPLYGCWCMRKEPA